MGRRARVVLAGLAAPPDTSRLQPCAPAETALAIEHLRTRYLRWRQRLAASGRVGATLHRVNASLNRLDAGCERLVAYGIAGNDLRGGHDLVPPAASPRKEAPARGYILVSEPFGALPGVVSPATAEAACIHVSRMLGRPATAALVLALRAFGEGALSRAADFGIRIRSVPRSSAFARCSPTVAALVPDIDSWPAPPAGLFVLEERCILLRSGALRMAAAHEFGHALDAVLAARSGSYLSFESPAIRRCFERAPGYVNEYAASGLDEYFAESLRAYVEVNDDRSSWLPLTRWDLKQRDPCMFAIIEDLLRTL
jgi:hypothetical protein